MWKLITYATKNYDDPPHMIRHLKNIRNATLKKKENIYKWFISDSNETFYIKPHT